VHSPDLGSPNEECEGGGPGSGEGGVPSSDFSNCVAQGFVLIVQEKNKDSLMKYWDDNSKGGSITFEFEHLVDLETVYILDIDEDKPVVLEVTTTAGKQDPVLSPPEYYGDNGLFPLAVNKANVEKLTVTFPGSGAVAQLDYIPHVCPDTDNQVITSEVEPLEAEAPAESPDTPPEDTPEETHECPKAEFKIGEGKVEAPLQGVTAMPDNNNKMEAPQDIVVPYWSNGEMVKFQGYQYWLDKSLSWVCFVWPDKNTGSPVAKKMEGQQPSDTRYFEARCVDGKATIQVFAHDGQFPDDSSATYPKACAGTLQTKTVMHEFEITCGEYGTDDGGKCEDGDAADVMATSSGGSGSESSSGSGKKDGGSKKKKRVRRARLLKQQ